MDERKDQRADDHQREEFAADEFAGCHEAAEQGLFDHRGAEELEEEDRRKDALLVGEPHAFLDGGFGDGDQDRAGGGGIIRGHGRVGRAGPELLRFAGQAALPAFARPGDEHEEPEQAVEESFGGGQVHEVSGRRAPTHGRRAKRGQL